MTRKLYSFIAFLTVLFTFSACQKEYLPGDGTAGGTSTGTAVFALAGTPGNCINPVVSGIYKAGTPLDISNKITVAVNVTDTGTYSISSGSVNGIIFSTAGKFTATGAQTIIFTAIGTPAAGGTFNFTIGNNGCTFSITCTGTIPVTDNCKECMYMPFCPGSTYLYADSTFNPVFGDTTVTERRADLLSSTDTAINNIPYKKIGISNGTATNYSYANCSNGETTTIAYNVQSTTSGNILVSIKSIDIKANAAIGTSWSDTTFFASGNAMYRKHTVAQKGISRTVWGVTYNDVIKVNVEQALFYNDPPVGLVPAGITDYYIAKGTGLIETITTAENPLTNETYIAYHSVLKSSFIP